METEKDTIVMKLLHYFITEKNYNPVILQGAQNEIWLENVKENYKIVRIVSLYIHNDEQLNFDLYKAKKIGKSIQNKIFSWDMNILSIYTNLGENAHLSNGRNFTTVKVSSDEELQNLDVLKEDFPDIRKKLKFSERGLELFLKITEDINQKNQVDAKRANEVFEMKKPYITYILIALNIFIYLFFTFFGKYDDVINDFALYGPFVRLGEYYRLLSCVFLHANIIHLALNCYALYILGPQLESYMGRWKYLLIYLFSGVIGSLLSITMNSSVVSIGASGAIFGVMGGLLYFGYHYRLYLGNVLKSQLVPLIIVNLFYGFLVPGIDNFAHIGGLIGGVLMTSLVGVKYKSSRSEQINGAIMTIIFTAFLVYMAIFAVH